MSFIPFTAGSTGIPLLAAPNAAGEKLIVVSSSTVDTGVATTLRGTVGSSPDSEVVTLSGTLGGRIEREGTKAFKTLTGAGITTGTAAGSISIRGQGTAGVGDVRVDSVPADGTTWEVGLVGFTQTYTFRTPASFIIATVAAVSLVTGDYFDIAVAGTTHRFWINKDGGGGAPGTPGGGTLTAVVVTTGDSAATVATTLEAAMESTITGFTCSASDIYVTCVKDVLGSATLTFTDGAATTGFAYVENSEGTADAANQIRTGYDTDGTAATTTDVALWVQYAVNATGGTAGTHYGTGTVANAYLSASASTNLATLTDRIACLRTLGWTRTDGTGLTTRTPLGGVNGTLMVALTGTESSGVAQDFDNADLADDNLLALYTGYTDGVFLNGQPSTLRLKIENVSSAITVAVQASDDGTTYETISGTSALTGTVLGTAAAYAVTGSGTAFLTELRVGEAIVIATYAYEVAAIASDTALTTREPLVTSPSGASATKLLPVQVASLNNNSQYIPLPQREYIRLDFLTNANTTDVSLHAGIIL